MLPLVFCDDFGGEMHGAAYGSMAVELNDLKVGKAVTVEGASVQKWKDRVPRVRCLRV